MDDDGCYDGLVLEGCFDGIFADTFLVVTEQACLTGFRLTGIGNAVLKIWDIDKIDAVFRVNVKNCPNVISFIFYPS